MALPLVSISCITYNHVEYIKNALDGFLMQKTTFSFEILIHDDASTDGTTEIVKDYEARYPDVIKPVYESENQWCKGRRGSAIFNFPRAKGKYIALCEGDDYWIDPFKLQKQVDFLENNIDFGLIHTDIEYVDINSKVISPPKELHLGIKKRIKNGFIFDYYLNNPGFIITCSCVFRKSLLDIEGAKQYFVFDHWIFMDIARKAQVYFMPEKTTVYRRNPEGIMMSKHSLINEYGPYVLLDQIYRFYNKNNFTNSYYVGNKIVEIEIASCYTKLIINKLLGKLKSSGKLSFILKNNFRIILNIPISVLKIFTLRYIKR